MTTFLFFIVGALIALVAWRIGYAAGWRRGAEEEAERSVEMATRLARKDGTIFK